MSQNLAVMQLQSNVMHLQSQLMLAHATIQAKDKAIEAQELALRVLGDARRQVALPAPTESPSSSKTEPVLGEVVRVGTYEKFGVHWNWAEIVRKLKRRPKRLTSPRSSANVGNPANSPQSRIHRPPLRRPVPSLHHRE
jgi:hypothetical protein